MSNHEAYYSQRLNILLKHVSDYDWYCNVPQDRDILTGALLSTG